MTLSEALAISRMRDVDLCRVYSQRDANGNFIHSPHSLRAQALDVLADEVERHDVLLCDVAQLLDGWHADGTAWTEHDESIRQRVSAAQWKLASVAPAKPRHCCGLTGFNPMKGDSCPACEKDGPK